MAPIDVKIPEVVNSYLELKNEVEVGVGKELSKALKAIEYRELNEDCSVREALNDYYGLDFIHQRNLGRDITTFIKGNTYPFRKLIRLAAEALELGVQWHSNIKTWIVFGHITAKDLMRHDKRLQNYQKTSQALFDRDLQRSARGRRSQSLINDCHREVSEEMVREYELVNEQANRRARALPPVSEAYRRGPVGGYEALYNIATDRDREREGVNIRTEVVATIENWEHRARKEMSEKIERSFAENPCNENPCNERLVRDRETGVLFHDPGPASPSPIPRSRTRPGYEASYDIANVNVVPVEIDVNLSVDDSEAKHIQDLIKKLKKKLKALPKKSITLNKPSPALVQTLTNLGLTRRQNSYGNIYFEGPEEVCDKIMLNYDNVREYVPKP